MNYYNEIKEELLNNEINKKVKDYSKNKYEIQKYYNVGKLLLEAGNSYGEGIIKEYSIKLTKEIGKKYSVRYLFDIRKLYLFSKMHPVGAQLTMSHYRLLFPLTDDNEINYYIDQINIEFNCYVVVELKVTELKKEHIGQIQVYMNYIDNNLRKINQDKTIGIIICKKENKYVIEYCSDERIIAREYELM